MITNQTLCRSSCWCRRTISRKRRRTRLRTTAPPTRPEVTNPARHGPELSIGIAFNIRSLPRCVIPFRFTRSYSERCVRRRTFGNGNEFTFVVCVPKPLTEPSCLKTKARFVIRRSVQKKSSTENRGKTSQRKEFQPYCAGDSAGVSSVPAGESVLPAGESVVAAGASVAAGLVTSVVAGGGVVGVALVAGVTVSVFCSHAARSAAPARMQMYFFIVRDAHCFS